MHQATCKCTRFPLRHVGSWRVYWKSLVAGQNADLTTNTRAVSVPICGSCAGGMVELGSPFRCPAHQVWECQKGHIQQFHHHLQVTSPMAGYGNLRQVPFGYPLFLSYSLTGTSLLLTTYGMGSVGFCIPFSDVHISTDCSNLKSGKDL
uniref:Uncharacterized protein n=1 Tax=Sphaerodactylus townsendi TaxID=933632 RepID=A0ACB8E7Q0_9SAUR